MADRVLFVGWGTPVRGCEERAVEVFNDAVGLYGRMQQEGRIEGFDVTLLEPNTSLNGFFSLRGSAKQLAEARESEDFQRTMIDAAMIVDDLRIIGGYSGAGVAHQMTMFAEAAGRIPQRA